jgi:hypothetical protein
MTRTDVFKAITTCIGLGVSLGCAEAQYGNQPSPPQYPGASPSPDLGMGSMNFTNRYGQRFEVGQLGSRLQNLRAAVDDALPLLMAFNENLSNSNAAGQGSLADAIAGLLSKNRNDSSQGSTAGGTSTQLTNLIGAVQGLLRTNGNNGAVTTAGTNTVQNLLALEEELRPVASLLHSLNLQFSGYPPGSPAFQPPTPTGR